MNPLVQRTGREIIIDIRRSDRERGISRDYLAREAEVDRRIRKRLSFAFGDPSGLHVRSGRTARPLTPDCTSAQERRFLLS